MQRARYPLLMQGAGTARQVSPEVAEYFRGLFDGYPLVLDAACGQGDVLWDGAVGADLDFEALRKTDQRVVQVDLQGSLPFAAGVFDGALAKDIIEHLSDPRAFLTEVARVTKLGGRLVVVTPRAIPRAVYADYTHVRGFTKQAIQLLLRDSGWTTEWGPLRMGGVPLAGRLKMVRWVPTLLRIPGFGHYFGTNWQVIGRRESR